METRDIIGAKATVGAVACAWTGQKAPRSMRYIIDIDDAQADRVEGHVTRESDMAPSSFSGWLELLSLLERPAAAPETTPFSDHHSWAGRASRAGTH